MGFHRATSLFTFGTIALLAACGDDGGGGKQVDAMIIVHDAPADAAPDAFIPDAPSYDFSCLGMAPPNTGPNPLTLSGSVNDINILAMTLDPVPDATVRAFRVGEVPALGAPDTSDMDGNWDLSIANAAMTSQDVYVEASKTGHRTNYLFPPTAVYESLSGLPILLMSNTTFQLFVDNFNQTQSPSNGTVGIAVVDCSNMPIDGATVSVTQNGQPVGNAFDASIFQPGAYLYFDVPPGDTVVGATYMNMTLLSRTVRVVAGATTTTAIRPGA